MGLFFGAKRLFVFTGLLIAVFGAPLSAAEILGRSTSLRSDDAGLTFTLGLSKPTPFKVFTIANPPRLLIDLGDTDLEGIPEGLAAGVSEVSALRYGLFKIGQARIVLELESPMRVVSALAGRGDFDDPLIVFRLEPSSAEEFAVRADSGKNSLWRPEQLVAEVQGESGLPLIAVDAGHGGLDQGASKGEVTEKVIALQMARQLRDTLLETGRFRVLLVRDADVFISLGERVEVARRAGADVFLSLHADIVTRGQARGTTVFSLSDADEDQQAVTIATLENRADLVAGISVAGEDDLITKVLLQLAYRETDALSSRFADLMAETLWFQNGSEIKSRRMAGGFRVLRAPDIPSVLIELGFMSDESDLEKMQNPEWQSAISETLSEGLVAWLEVAEEMRGLLRN
ncbi:MAG: N-acetylmuramoyl-L-alanine amidase [Rhodobacteraceae bacterium]|nr:N-acetylmuramoyl-L-alanine amidase [Paracoccaceae bacterium]